MVIKSRMTRYTGNVAHKRIREINTIFPGNLKRIEYVEDWSTWEIK
jgi:hypothetical protein